MIEVGAVKSDVTKLEVVEAIRLDEARGTTSSTT